MPYRDDLEALEYRCKALEAQSAVIDGELAEARQLLAEAQARRRLLVDHLQIAAPCSADWARMVGDERVRFCAHCEKNVYNLSALTHAEAEALVVAKEGNLCLRYFERADGTILTADCPVGVTRRRRRRRIAAAAFGAVSALTAVGAAAWDDYRSPKTADEREIELILEEMRAGHHRMGKYSGAVAPLTPATATTPAAAEVPPSPAAVELTAEGLTSLSRRP